MSTPPPTMIALRGVSKLYSLRADKQFLLRDIAMRLAGRKPRTMTFWALRDVTLDIRRGESVAVVGRNGAGKSTLLSVIAGTVYPTSGDVITHGRVSALLELGVGFNPDLTGRENVFLNAALLGMEEDDIRARFPDILAFSELEQFIDTPISKYSSGMIMRLGFSVAIHIEPEIMIIDEILSVGDAAFQTKCMTRMQALKERGTTFLVVSHAIGEIQRFCNRGILLDHGSVAADGPVADVIARYRAVTG